MLVSTIRNAVPLFVIRAVLERRKHRMYPATRPLRLKWNTLTHVGRSPVFVESIVVPDEMGVQAAGRT